MKSKRVFFERVPFPVRSDCHYSLKPLLPCSWIADARSCAKEPEVTLFQLDFVMGHDDAFTIHVSADQQYILYIDGECVGRGCEMKSPENWFFESYEILPEQGPHRISALVWHYGELSPANRMSVSPGFFLMPDERFVPLLGTGVAPWKVRAAAGTTFSKLEIINWNSIPPHETFDCREFFHGDDGWHSPSAIEQGRNGAMSAESGVHLLKPSMTELFRSEPMMPGKAVFIADMKDENGFVPDNRDSTKLGRFNAAFNKAGMLVPALAARRVIIDLENYYCAYTTIKLKGGRDGRVRITWAEAAFTHPEKLMKGQRDTIAGKYFRGAWDEFLLDGEERELSPLAWRCGRFIELYIVAAGEPVELESFTLRETRYPLEMDGGFSCDDEKLNAIVPFCFRTLQMSAHENFVDCPFYEQLLYAGDGRLEALVNLATCADDTLVRKALSTLAASRDTGGCIMARWPSTSRQYIPSFSLWWVGMLHDYALWRDDKAFVAALIPGMRFLLDHFLGRMDEGFLRGVEWEWNFIDWVDEWSREHESGAPPGIVGGVNASYNWLLAYALTMAQRLEEYAGDRFLAARWEEKAKELSSALTRRFWDAEKGLFREDDSGEHFSAHAQIMALLSACVDKGQAEKLKASLPTAEGLPKCSIFYRHYLFEALAILGYPDNILSGLSLWGDFLDKGFKTVPETPENKTFNQRSDCHGWGAHPIYHLITNIAGLKPAEMGFKSIRVSPRLGRLRELKAACACPGGLARASFTREGSVLRAEIFLPEGLSGTWHVGAASGILIPGNQSFSVEGDI
jgi:hypothetical protein